MAAKTTLATAFVALVALSAQHADGRAVNISNTWILPQEGFPVFYRYFRDRISWYEADAVCQFHHANLVTVDTTQQYDAARAYLKELDIMSNVWIGLIKSNEEGDFSWTDYKPLSGEGYWGAAPSDGRAPLCAALDPARDFRWAALSCGGPQVASFICELPVPTWALSESGGCLIKSLPSLTVQYLPELAAVQLASDCGLDGTRSVTCKANEQHKDILKELSCFILEDDFGDNVVTAGLDSSASSGSTSHRAGSSWSPNPTTPATGDYSSSTRLRRETPDSSTPMTIVSTTAIVGSSQTTTTIKPIIEASTLKPTTIEFTATTHAPIIVTTQTVNHTTSVKSAEIAPVSENPTKASSAFTEQPKKDDLKNINLLDSAKSNQVPMTNVLGNSVEEPKIQKEHVDIYTQATDHFIPPLVMAKSKLSTDMTLVSPESKHIHKASPHYPTTHSKTTQHSETLIMKPKVVKSSDEVFVPSTETLVSTQSIETKAPIVELTTTHIISSTNDIVTTSKPTTENIVVKKPTNVDDVDIKKYKKPTKGKKYDKSKEEKKKPKELNAEATTVAAETEHKIVQITIAGTTGANAQPTIIDVTTRIPDTVPTIATITTKTKMTEDKTLSTEGPTTNIMIDANIMKLNKAGTPNNDSEPITIKNSAEKLTVKHEETTHAPIATDEQTTSSSNSAESVTERDPEPIPRPNRSRLLTHPPQHRSFYPYFFNRVLG